MGYSRWYSIRPLAAALGWLLLASGGGGAARAGTIAPELQQRLAGAARTEPVPVLVDFTGRVDLNRYPRGSRSRLIRALQAQAAAAQGPVLDFLKLNRVTRMVPLWLTNHLAATVPAGMVGTLAAQPGVTTVRLDVAVPLAESAPGIAVAPDGWNLAALQAPALWDLGYDGAGVVVATMDTGADVRHADLQGRWRGGANSWFDPNGQHATPYDRHGHGTQVLGLLVGGSAGGSPVGVAPAARWIAVKIFNDSGVAPLSAIHAGYQWLLDPDGDPATDDAPDVVNNSWGLQNSTNVCLEEFHDDLAVLRAAGIAVVFAAGNDGPGPASSLSPANDPGSFAVGALNDALTAALFSSRGPSPCDGRIWPKVTAPGVNLRTTDLTSGGVFPFAYAYVSGASFAAPEISGALALLRQAFPELTTAELEDGLRAAAQDLGVSGPDNDYGAGLPDLLAAYALLLNQTMGADKDGDGYYTGPAGGVRPDCDDNDASIHPGAPEIKHDGIDQDCNGYDLTIDITQAVYRAAADSLMVTATSALLGSGAIKGSGLDLAGHGPMTRKSRKGQVWWELTVKHVHGNPGAVTVSGAEGAASAPTTVQ